MPAIRKRCGKYQVQIRRQGQPDSSRTFSTIRDAKEWARTVEVQADRCELGPDRKSLKRISLAVLVVRYRDEVAINKRGARDEVIVLNAFLRHPICQRALSELSTADFAKYRDERLLEVKPATLRRQLNPIQNMFEVARDEWGIPIKENPLTKLKLKATDNKRERRLREGELERIIQASSKNRNPYVLPVILFALETAMRRGEILSLQWDQVDLKRSSVTILESKNGYSRTIPLSPKALELLHSCMDIGECSKGNSDLVFPITPNALRLSWVRLCRRADITNLHFHDLRHEAISRFFELGLTVPEVASISGHRDIRMLMRYAHANVESISSKFGIGGL